MLRARRPFGRLFHWFILVVMLSVLPQVRAAGPGVTTVVDVIYRADGTPAQGTLLISWPAFATKQGEAVAAGTKSVKIGVSGSIRIGLAPNTGSLPAGTHYRVVLQLDDGTTATEYWVIPDSGETSVAAIRSKVVPASMAAQFVARDYIDSALAGVSGAMVVHKTGDESVSGVKAFAASPTVPGPMAATDVANKSYVDAADASGKIYTDAAVSAKASEATVLHKTGDEGVGGVKTFALSPVVPSPTGAQQVVNKAYVDAAMVNSGGGVALKTNGTVNSSQATLDLKAGANVSLIDGGNGAITIHASGVAGPQGVAGGPFAGLVQVDGSTVTNLQAGISAAGTSKALLIPADYAGRDTFTNPNHVAVMDLRRIGDLRGGELSLKDFGANGDKRSYEACGITAGSDTLICAAIFKSTDVGLPVLVMGAGVAGADLVTTVSGYTSATQVTITTAASTTMPAATGPNYRSGVVVGTNVDDTSAFVAAMAALKGDQTKAGQGGGTLKVPPGTYTLNQTQVIANWNASNTGNRVTIECVGGYNTARIIWTGATNKVAFQVGDGTNTNSVPPVSILGCGWRGIDSIHVFTPMQAVRGVSHEFSKNNVGPYTKNGVNWSQTWLGKIEFNNFYGPETGVLFDNACNVFSQALRGVDDGCPVNGVTVANNEFGLMPLYGVKSSATGQGGSNGNTYRENDFEGAITTTISSLELNDTDTRVVFNRFEDNGSLLTSNRSLRMTGGRNVISGNSWSLGAPAVATVTSNGANRFTSNYWSHQTTYDLEEVDQVGNDPDSSVGESLVRAKILYSGTANVNGVIISGQTVGIGAQSFYDNGTDWFKQSLALDNPHKVTAQHVYGYSPSTYSYASAAVVAGKTAPNTPAGAIFGRPAGGSAFVWNQGFDGYFDGNPLGNNKVLGWVCENVTPDSGCVSTGGGNYSSGTWREVGTIRSNKVREGTRPPMGAGFDDPDYAGPWNVGDFIWNTNPTGTNPIIGWVGTVAGTPGTWVPLQAGPSANSVTVTTKGDLQGFSTVAARLSVGTDSTCLVADSSQTLGLRWASCGASGSYTNLFQSGDSLEQRNGATGQHFKVYSTYTDSANNGYIEFDGSTTGLGKIITKGLGSVAAPWLYLISGANVMYTGISGAINMEWSADHVSPYSSTNTMDLGQLGNHWFFRSGYFDTMLKVPTLELTTRAAYTCNSTTRGQFNYIAGGAGVKDIVQVCGKDGADVYAWRTIY